MALAHEPPGFGDEVHGACSSCGRVRRMSLSCETRTVRLGGVIYLAVPYGRETWRTSPPRERCMGCGALPNGLHHERCSEAQCPKCAGRIMRCRCSAF